MPGAHTCLYIWDDRFLYSAPAIDIGPTERYSLALLIAWRPRGLHFDAGSHGAGHWPAALVAPRVRRSLQVEGGGFLSLNLDPDSYDHRTLQRWMDGRGVVPLPRSMFESCRSPLRRLLDGTLSGPDAFQLTLDLVAAVGLRPAREVMDLRVLHVARILRSRLPSSLPAQELAAAVGLSAERLSHLFSEQVGVSMKNYLLWARLRRSRLLMQSGVPMLQAALEAGFSDQAHFSRTFHRFFGLRPSALGRSTGVRVHIG